MQIKHSVSAGEGSAGVMPVARNSSRVSVYIFLELKRVKVCRWSGLRVCRCDEMSRVCEDVFGMRGQFREEL